MRTVELPVTTEWTPELLETLPGDYRYEVPESRASDRVLKPAKYAEAGVPEYWRVEEDRDGEALVYQHRLVRGETADLYAEKRIVLLSTLEKESQ